MMPEAFIPPNMSVLPFEMFRSFGPTFDKHRPFTAWTPPCDIYETEKEIVLKMELPEMRKEDVHVTLKNNVLTLRGERKFEETVNRENYHLIERKCGEFIRIFTLPTFVEGSKVVAEYKEGMLAVRLPKDVADVPRQIEVKVM
ncbi:MAG: Hsp20/alpha crystallin family protein [Acidobacteriota bacterium]|nr:Hsp20/alpha crystallin family protein [Acidobacteriota bacterium]